MLPGTMYARCLSRNLGIRLKPSKGKKCVVTCTRSRTKSTLVGIDTDADTGIATIDLNRLARERATYPHVPNHSGIKRMNYIFKSK